MVGWTAGFGEEDVAGEVGEADGGVDGAVFVEEVVGDGAVVVDDGFLPIRSRVGMGTPWGTRGRVIVEGWEGKGARGGGGWSVG